MSVTTTPDADLLRHGAGDAHHHERVEVRVRVRLELRERGDVLRPDRLRVPAHQVARPPDRLVAVRLRAPRELDRLVGGRHDRARCSEFELHQLFTPASRLHIPSGSMSSRSSRTCSAVGVGRLRHLAVREEQLEAGRLLHLLDRRARMDRAQAHPLRLGMEVEHGEVRDDELAGRPSAPAARARRRRRGSRRPSGSRPSRRSSAGCGSGSSRRGACRASPCRRGRPCRAGAPWGGGSRRR